MVSPQNRELAFKRQLLKRLDCYSLVCLTSIFVYYMSAIASSSAFAFYQGPVHSCQATLSRFGLSSCVACTRNVRSLSSHSRQPTHLFAVSTPSPPRNIAIVGGGLAGLSTAYHLLLKTGDDTKITIIDRANPGEGGASSVAGGLLHPFSPKGKLVHMGMEGLETTNILVSEAAKHRKECIVRDKIYRIALLEKNVKDLKLTSELYPNLAVWLTCEQLQEDLSLTASGKSSLDDLALGGILISNGCKVIHVPSYLQGLWAACLEMSNGRVKWSMEAISSSSVDETDGRVWNERLSAFDAVVFSAGSGLFHDSILQNDATNFPAEIVRGQSAELTTSPSAEGSCIIANEAILCGKYTAPLLEDGRLVIGATHEYKAEALDKEGVVKELKERAPHLSSIWDDDGTVVDRITSGYRVQSKRGQYGRMPIIGQCENTDVHENGWIFTGLSSRGLIYHGIYGEMLSTAVLTGDEKVLLEVNPDALWWKKGRNS